MNGEALARRIVVRHRGAGYLRLELPPEICHAAATTALDAALRAVGGVYRVSFYPARRRLVVSHDFHSCTTADVARALRDCLGGLPQADARPLPGERQAVPAVQAGRAAAPAATPAARLTPVWQDAVRQARRGFTQLRSRIEALRQPKARPGTLQAKLEPMLANALTEKAIINFLNDLVAFYLVKVHWELISQRWLKDPVKHANAWLTVFYLMFLLVRYRKSIAAEAAKPVSAAQP